MIEERFKDRFDKNTYSNDAPCFIQIAADEIPVNDSKDDICLEIPERLLQRLINIGQAYDLHLISIFDLYEDIYLNTQQCKNLLDELDLVEEITNDILLHDYVKKIRKLASNCIRVTNWKLLIGGN